MLTIKFLNRGYSGMLNRDTPASTKGREIEGGGRESEFHPLEI